MPPEGLLEAVPLLLPAQVIGVDAAPVLKAAGDVTAAELVLKQPLLSFTVSV